MKDVCVCDDGHTEINIASMKSTPRLLEDRIKIEMEISFSENELLKKLSHSHDKDLKLLIDLFILSNKSDKVKE